MIDRLHRNEDDAAGFRRLRVLWWALVAGHGVVMLALVAYLTGRGEAPSGSLRVLSLGLTGVALLVVMAAVWLNPTRLQRIQGLVTPWRWVLGGVLLAALCGFGMGIRPEPLYGLAGLALAATAALVWGSFVKPLSGLPSGVARSLVLALLLGILVVRAYGLSSWPDRDDIDEPWNLSWSVTYLQTGEVSEIQRVGEPGDPTYYTTAYIPRWSVLVAGWLNLVGVGIWQGRLFSLLLTVPLALLTALAARNVYGRTSALFTFAAVLLSSLLVAGLRLRHDIGLSLAVALSVWLFTEACKRERTWLHVAAGLAIGAGGFAHYHIVGFAPALAVALYLPRLLSVQGERSLRSRAISDAVGYGAGLLVGVGLFVLVQVAPDVATFLANRAPRNPSQVSNYLGSFLGYLEQLTLISWYDALLILLGLLAAVFRLRVTQDRTRRTFDASLILLFVLAHLALPAMSARVREIYLVPVVPVYALLVGTLLSEMRFGSAFVRPLILVFAGLCFLAPMLGQTIRTPLASVLARKPVIEPVPVAAQWVLADIPAGASVLASNYYYPWLTSYNFISPHVTEPVPAEVLDSYPSRAEFWLSLEPDVIILDPERQGTVLIEMLDDDIALLERNGYHLASVIETEQGAEAPIWVRGRPE